jgi:hypothetical protein
MFGFLKRRCLVLRDLLLKGLLQKLLDLLDGGFFLSQAVVVLLPIYCALLD